MGWSFSRDTRFGKDELVKELRNEGTRKFWNDDVTVVATSVVGNNVWQVLETPEEKFIGLTLIKSGGRDSGWGYKSMEESSGPYEINCPLSFLDMVPEPDSQYAKDFRGRVRAYHERQRAKRNLTVGDAVSIDNRPYRLVTKLHRGWAIEDMATGKFYRSRDIVPITQERAQELLAAVQQKVA